jgi:hypothetical protein
LCFIGLGFACVVAPSTSSPANGAFRDAHRFSVGGFCCLMNSGDPSPTREASSYIGRPDTGGPVDPHRRETTDQIALQRERS